MENHQFEPDVKLVIIKQFYGITEASLYQSRLKSADINSFISNENISNLVPYGAGGILLHIKESDQEKALEIIKELDSNKVTRSDQDFTDATKEDIEFEKQITDYEKSLDSPIGTKNVLFLCIAFIIIVFIIYLTNGNTLW